MKTTKLLAALAAATLIAACADTTDSDATAATGGVGAGAAGLGAGQARPGSQEDLVANVGDRVFFDYNVASVRADQRPVLERQAGWLQRYPQVAVTIEGHADERGTREYNFSLSARRAQTVRDYLASRGINPSRFRTVSYGKERPVAVCNDISCWSQNRRAVTVLDAGAGA
jgi:peptidoglycan-associated lipoprotein